MMLGIILTILTSVHASRQYSASTKVESGQVKFAAEYTSKFGFILHLSAIRAVSNTDKTSSFYCPKIMPQN